MRGRRDGYGESYGAYATSDACASYEREGGAYAHHSEARALGDAGDGDALYASGAGGRSSSLVVAQ